MVKLNLLCCFVALCISSTAIAQQVQGEIHGEIVDVNSETPIPFASITIVGSSPPKGSSSDIDGQFVISNIDVGRISLEVSCIGYETMILSEVVVRSKGNEFIRVGLRENMQILGEIVVRPTQEKERPLNKMATVSAKQLNMEEASRYAGGFDDPARLVSSFAGVAGSVGNNLLVVRGNSPKGILWQIEGIPVPNPNHFGEITGFGGGGITALSSTTIGNSDFFTGAFPAEYGSALSSVFDLTIRNGNSHEYHHSFQASFLGLDLASEGPISRKSNSSYLINYRYSTLGLLGLGIQYQDLSFKVNLPTKNIGNFSIWGLGLIDATDSAPDPDTTEVGSQWQYYDDLSTETAKLATGILGISHKNFFGEKMFVKTTVTASSSNIIAHNSRLDSTYSSDYQLDNVEYQSMDYRIASVLNTKFGRRHTNKTGVLFTNLNFNFKLEQALEFGLPLSNIANDNGSGNLMQAYSQSSFILGKWQINPGVHYLYFTLNDKHSLEPRLGINFRPNDRNTWSLGYGLHSQVEKLSFYLADVPVNGQTKQLNKSMGLTKAHHVVLSYDRMFGERTHLRIEPYFQYLFNVPVIDNSYFSMSNVTDDFFINSELQNSGTAQNMGVDLTIEQFFHKGFYYLVTMSIFDSKYIDGAGQEHNTPFNRKLISNVLVGKEWLVKSRNLFSANMKYTYLGGGWQHPVRESESLENEEVVLDYNNPYSVQNPTSHVVSVTFTYRINKKRHSSLWSLQVLNVLGAKEYLGYQYNFKEHTIDVNTDAIILPNLSYRFEF